MRDKDGVNASLLIAEAAAWAKTQGKTLYDILQEIYKTYGYYVEKVVSVTLPGKDGVVKMKEIMKSLRENPPKELAGKKVLAVRDYLADTRTDCEGHVTPAGLPKSDVLYFELVDDDVGLHPPVRHRAEDQALRQHERQASGGFRQGERRAG